MFLPVMVERLEQDRLLDAAPRLRVDLRCLAGRGGVRHLLAALLEDFGIDRILLHPVVDRRRQFEDAREALLHAPAIPLLEITAWRAGVGDDRIARLDRKSVG